MSATSPKPPTKNLIVAAKRGLVDTVRQLLDTGAKIDQRDKESATALIWACRRNRAEVLTELVGRGADLLVQDGFGRSALFMAAYGCPEKSVRALVEAGAPVNVADQAGFTPLLMAAMKGRSGVVRYLVEKGADARAADNHGLTALHRLTPYGKREALKALLDAGADVNAADRDGATPVFGVLDPVTLCWMLERGADIRVRCTNGNTTLLHCCYPRPESLPCLRLLLDAGADIDAQDDSGTALHRAAQMGEIAQTHLLIERGADVNVVAARSGMTPLMCAASNPATEPELLDLLLDADADIEARSLRGETVLFYAARSGNSRVVERLLERGADPCAKNDLGQMPLEVHQTHPRRFYRNTRPEIAADLAAIEALLIVAGTSRAEH